MIGSPSCRVPVPDAFKLATQGSYRHKPALESIQDGPAQQLLGTFERSRLVQPYAEHWAFQMQFDFPLSQRCHVPALGLDLNRLVANLDHGWPRKLDRFIRRDLNSPLGRQLNCRIS